MTNFLSSVAMAVIFPLVLWNKILQCQADSALDIAGVRVEVSLTKDALERASSSAVGVCLTEFISKFMRDLSDTKGKHKIASIISNLITDIGWFVTNQPNWHTMEAVIVHFPNGKQDSTPKHVPNPAVVYVLIIIDRNWVLL
jgi:hypothetical protein